MDILLAFLPFVTFAAASRFAGTTTALLLGAAASLALTVYGVAIKKQSIRILEAGTLILFGGLTAYSKLASAQWPVLGVRLGVDSGLLIIVLCSMALKQPFTLQYAKESVPKVYWGEPSFVRTNFKLTAVWAAAFAAIVAADALMFFLPRIPMAVGIAVTVAALFVAARVTAKVAAEAGGPSSKAVARDAS
jgi:hypothetical protein